MNLPFLLKSLASLISMWLITSAALYFYIDYSGAWTILGHGRELLKENILWQELVLVLVLVSGLHFYNIKNIAIRFLLPLLPIIIAYLFCYKQIIPRDSKNA